MPPQPEPKATVAPLTRDQRFALKLQAFDIAFRLAKGAISGAVVCFVAYMAYRSVDAMAGKSTDFKSAVNWVVSVNASELVAWAAALGFGGAYGRERHRNKRLALASDRNGRLELDADPGRTGSGLDTDGNPPEGQP